MYNPAAIAALKASLRGELLQPDDAGYEAARTVYNGMIDRRPRLIVRCINVADVITAVKFAGKHQLLVAIRGGGHNGAGLGTCDDGLVIDLSRMKGIRVDPVARTVQVERLYLGGRRSCHARLRPGHAQRDHFHHWRWRVDPGGRAG